MAFWCQSSEDDVTQTSPLKLKSPKDDFHLVMKFTESEEDEKVYSEVQMLWDQIRSNEHLQKYLVKAKPEHCPCNLKQEQNIKNAEEAESKISIGSSFKCIQTHDFVR